MAVVQQNPPQIPVPDMGTPAATSEQGDDYLSHAGPPLKTQPSYHASYHAHPQQQIKDTGPQIRQSRLPLFKHVRSILHKPPPITTPGNPKWDDYTGELSDNGRPSSVKPSTYVSPYHDAFKFSRKRLSKARKNHSPVSVLNDDELTPIDHMQEDEDGTANLSPVSPISAPSQVGRSYEDEVDQSLVPEPLSPNIQRKPAPEQQTTPSPQQIKRKPVSRDFSSMENYPPVSSQHSPSQSSDMSANAEEVKQPTSNQPKSHFSWTTYAASVVPGRASIDTMAASHMKGSPEVPRSRFSWSTVATNVTNQPSRPDTAPASPPPVPVHYATAPVQSILSRRRPIQRVEKAAWAPPQSQYRARSDESPRSLTPKNSSTPTSASTARPHPPPQSLTPTSKSNSPSTSKALPPPPQLHADNNLSHLETLLAQERDIVLQRRNVERAIFELEKVGKASPLDVPFATVRDAKKRLAEYRIRLDEVRLEERDIGISIARGRRREEKEQGGDGETLWIRRVTG